MATLLRIDPEQRFTCASCGRCCRRLEIVVSPAEVATLRARDAARWFREDDDSPESSDRDPFEPIAGWRGYYRIRQRPDGTCGFLSPTSRCRLHEELGDGQKPLTCRMFPYRLHPAEDAVIVTTSFACPTVVANHGDLIASGMNLESIRALRTEWFSTHPSTAAPRRLIAGREMGPAPLFVLQDGLLKILNRSDGGRRDLRLNVRRMAMVLDDLTRTRVTRLPDADFAEYVRLTVPYAASSDKPVDARPPTWIGRLLQRGFLFVVAATRMRLEHPGMSRLALRLRAMWLLLHVHGLAPPLDRIDMKALSRARVDINAPDIQPIAYHYLRASLHAMGVTERPVLDNVAIAVSGLNAACALTIMNGTPGNFGEALIEATGPSHIAERGLVGRTLARLAGGTEALYFFGNAATPTS